MTKTGEPVLRWRELKLPHLDESSSEDYIFCMKFEWDTQKSETCFANRGFDFAYAARAFFDPGRMVRRDERHDYGETRYILFGLIEHRLFCVVFTVRRGRIRIISARKANLREVKVYDDHLHDPAS